jgi:hypothetical protein
MVSTVQQDSGVGEASYLNHGSTLGLVCGSSDLLCRVEEEALLFRVGKERRAVLQSALG